MIDKIGLNMALQVWLPLNRNIENQGLKKLSVTNNGATVNANGKIGKCYYFNGNAQYLQLSESLGDIYSGDFTWALWLKPTDDTRGVLISEYSSQGSSNVALELQTSRKIRVYWNGSPDYVFTYAAPKNTWSHLAIVKTNNLIKLYADGVLVDTKSGTLSARPSTSKIRIGDDYRGGNTVSYMGYLNDVRIYDNALSENDVKDLYYGKVLEIASPWGTGSSNIKTLGDASGIKMGLTPHNLTASGSTLSFNGSSSYIEFDGLNMSGGTVSIWANIASKPASQRIYYCDPTSKMIIGYLAGGTILTSANSQQSGKASYQSTGITWGQMHHILAVWDSNKQPLAFYVNGVQAATGTTSNWTNSGEIASIGRRIGSGSADYLNGLINSVKVYSHQFTAEEAKREYEKGPCGNDWGHRSNIRLEYIESTGTQYIDTGYIPKSNTEIIIDAELTQADANVTIAGNHYLANASTISKRFHVGTYQSKWHFGVGNNSSWYNFPSPVPDTKRHIFRILADGNCYVDDKTYKLSPGTTVSNVSVGLFCVHGYIPSSNTHSYYQNAKVKIYRVTMKEGGVIVMDLVPVYYNGECYLLDLVSHEMKGNGGTGSFLYGIR